MSYLSMNFAELCPDRSTVVTTDTSCRTHTSQKLLFILKILTARFFSAGEGSTLMLLKDMYGAVQQQGFPWQNCAMFIYTDVMVQSSVRCPVLQCQLCHLNSAIQPGGSQCELCRKEEEVWTVRCMQISLKMSSVLWRKSIKECYYTKWWDWYNCREGMMC